MQNEILKIISEALSECYSVPVDEARRIVMASFLPELLRRCPDYVGHYDAEYWAAEIMDTVRA